MAIHYNLLITASPATVFNAITSTIGLQGWWAKVCDIDCRVDQVSSVRFIKPDIVEEMLFKTTEFNTNKKMVWLCVSNNVFESWVGTTLSFELNKDGEKTHLAFTQVSADKNWKRHPDFRGTKQGWDYFMESLKNFCEAGEGDPWG
jgi:uncharacterized protein YndB with AHSA1/START domain